MLIVTCALIEKGDKVLITQRSEQMSLPYLWEFPGGKQEPGETLETCIQREIQEELQVDIVLKAQLPTCFHEYSDKSLQLIPFIAEIPDGIPTLTEHLDLAWVDAGTIQQFELAPADQKIWGFYLSYLDKQKTFI